MEMITTSVQCQPDIGCLSVIWKFPNSQVELSKLNSCHWFLSVYDNERKAGRFRRIYKCGYERDGLFLKQHILLLCTISIEPKMSSYCWNVIHSYKAHPGLQHIMEERAHVGAFETCKSCSKDLEMPEATVWELSSQGWKIGIGACGTSWAHLQGQVASSVTLFLAMSAIWDSSEKLG